jgi:hypothetical protein
VTELDFVVVGSDLIGVLLHAIFDAHDGLPAVSNATGVALGHALSVNVPGSAGHLSAEDFGEVGSSPIGSKGSRAPPSGA